MAVNLIDRTPIPGSFGVLVNSNVVMHLTTDENVLQSSVTVQIDDDVVIDEGVFQPGFAGTMVTDGDGGWTITINPTANFAYDSEITVDVSCEETPSGNDFQQQYTFRTIKNVEASASARYYEEGDIVEIDVSVTEAGTLAPKLVDSISVQLLRDGHELDRFQIVNASRKLDSDGQFCIRFLHPLTITRELDFVAAVVIDGREAPGVGSVSLTGTIEYLAKAQRNLSAKQPSRVGATLPGADVQQNLVPSIIASDAAEYESVDISQSGDALVEPTDLVHLDFLNSANYLVALTGDVEYSGGGNRLLVGIDDTTDFFMQEADEFPPTFGARTLLEGATTNLFPNSDLSINNFTVTVPDNTVRQIVEASDFAVGVKQLTFEFEGTVSYDNVDRITVIASPKVNISAGQPVLVGFLARTELRDDKVTLDTFVVRVKFFNSSNVQVGSQDFAFDPFDIESDTVFSNIEALVPAGSVPGTAAKVSFDIRLGSWEACDLARLVLVAPSIEQAGYTTSRVVGPGTTASRLADALRIPQPGNMNHRAGRMEIEYAPQYDGYPPVNVAMFDTRMPSTQFSGYTCVHRTDGHIVFTVSTDAGVHGTHVSAAPVSLPIGEPVKFTCSWSPAGGVKVTKDKTLVVNSAGVPPVPTNIPSYIVIGADSDGNTPLLGEIHSFRSYGTP